MKEKNITGWGLFFLTLVFFISALFCCQHFHFFNLIPGGTIKENIEAAANISMELTGMAVCSFLYASLIISEKKNRFRSLFQQLLFFEDLILFCDCISWIISGKLSYNSLLIVSNAVFLVCAGIIFQLFWNSEIEIMNIRTSIPKPVLYGIRIAAVTYYFSVFLNIKFGFYYTISNAMYFPGKYRYLQYIFPAIVCLVLLYYACTVKILVKIKLPYILMAIVPLITIIIQNASYSLSLMYMSVLAVIIILYINIHVNLGFKIEEFKNKVMISQIQPHFMYNTLTTIKALCREDPGLAAKTITNFADYLRCNMDFASLETTIPFEKELKHTKTYVEIEKLRFDNITFEFNIEDSDFEVPALVVQPMVENAVRHGVRNRKDGHILVHTFADEAFHNIVVQDNGKGFVKGQFNGSRTHIGLTNTRVRIERIVHGSFKIDSIPEKGVTITMRIPK